jgi:hypothetical protein
VPGRVLCKVATRWWSHRFECRSFGIHLLWFSYNFYFLLFSGLGIR